MSTFYRHIIAGRFLVLPVLMFLALVCSASGEPDLDSLLIQSIGGPAALETATNLTSISTYGQVDLNGMKGTMMTMFVPPTNYYFKAEFGDFGFVQAFDGTTAWRADHNGFVSELSGEERKVIVRSTYLESYSYLVPNRVSGIAKYFGKVELEDTSFHMVAFVIDEEDTLTVLFDLPSGMPRRLVSRTDNVQTVVLADDFRKVDNLMIAFHAISVELETELETEVLTDSIILDAPVDMSIFKMKVERPADVRFPLGCDKVVVPFVYESGHIMIPARINGSRNAWFILDSGASANILNADAVAGLGLEEVGSLPVQGLVGYDEIQLVKVDSLEIEDLTLVGQVSGVSDISSLGSSCPPGGVFGGLLGHDFLSRFPVMINYRDTSLVVYNPETFVTPAGGHSVSFRLVKNVPTIQADLDGLVGEYLIDLGNAVGLVVHPAFAKKHRLLERLREVREEESSLSGIGGAAGGKRAIAGQFKIGAVSISSPEVFIPDASGGLAASVSLAGNIGRSILEQFSILFDYANRTVVFYQE